VQRQRAYVGGGLQPGTALVVVCLAVVTLPPSSTAPTVAGCRLVGCSVVSVCLLLQDLVQRCLHGGGGDMGGHVLRQRTASTQSRCGGGVTARLCRPGARSGLPCPVPACCCRGRLARAGSGSHSGVELWRSRTGKGSSGGRKKGVV
jgi:hypothetical protein